MNSALSIIIVEKDRDRALLSVLSVNGTMIGVSLALAERVRAMGYAIDFARAMATGRALLAAADGPLRIGVPFPFSMHAELIHYWLAGRGQPAPGVVILPCPRP